MFDAAYSPDTRDAMAAHSSPTGLLVVKEHPCVVRHATFVGTAETRKDRPVGLKSVFVGANVGSFASLIRDAARKADAVTGSELFQLGFCNEASALGRA